MVRARRLQRRHRWPGTRVRPRTHEAPRLGTPPRATKWALKQESPWSTHERYVLNSEARARDAHAADSRGARMNAVRLFEYGGQLVLSDVPTPTIARDEILVKI